MRNLIKKLFGKKRVKWVNVNIKIENIKFGVIPSKRDDRDYLFILPPVSLPAVVDNSQYYNVKYQGNIGSCGAFAAINGLEHLDKVREPKRVAELSEAFMYWKVRQSDYMNTFPVDSGSNGRNLMKVLNKEGAILDSFYPYSGSTFNDGPKSNSVFISWVAKFWKIKKYEKCLDLTSIKNSLSLNKPVWLGVSCQESWYYYGYEGILEYDSSKPSIGGHAIALVGYDDSKNAFKFVNSWGTNWGDNGFGYLSYDYLVKCIFWEAWTYEV